jgi:hypothetical protein
VEPTSHPPLTKKRGIKISFLYEKALETQGQLASHT